MSSCRWYSSDNVLPSSNSITSQNSLSFSKYMMPPHTFMPPRSYSSDNHILPSRDTIEKIWSREGYFGEIKPVFFIKINNFPENAVTYINQAYKNNNTSQIYCDYFVLGQIIPLKIQPEAIIDEFCTKFYTPSYNLNTGEFLGINETTGYIMLHNVEKEAFFSYGDSEEHASTLFCHQKQPIVNTFKGHAFDSHRKLFENESTMSDIFFYLPSITDRKEDINKSLIPVALSSKDFPLKGSRYKFNPNHLETRGKYRNLAMNTLHSFFKKAAKVSNSNLIDNANSLLKKKGIPLSEVKWPKSPSHLNFCLTHAQF